MRRMRRCFAVVLLCLAGCSEAQDVATPAPRPAYSPPLQAGPSSVLATRQSAVDRSPSDVDAWLALGQTYLADKHFGAAAICFEQVVRLDADSGLGWMFLALCREELGASDAALEAYQASARTTQPPPAAYWRAALLHLDLGQPELAATLAGDAVKQSQGGRMARLVLGRSLLELSRPRDAAGVLGEVVKNSPADRYAHLLHGRALQRAGLRGAASHMRLGRGADPVWTDPWTTAALTHGVSLDARHAIAVALLAQGQFDRALAVARLLQQEAPDQVGYQILLSKALRSAGAVQEALDVADMVLRANPDDHAGHTQAAGARFARWQELSRDEDLAAALSHLDRAIHLTESDGQNWMLRAEVRRLAGDLQGAAADAVRAAEAMPHKPGLVLQAANLHLQIESPDKAIELLDQLQVDFPEDVNLLVLRGRARLLAGDPDGARRDAALASALAPSHPGVRALTNLLAQP